MPRYEITSPEGKRFEVNAPDGASQEDVLAYAQQQFTQPAPKYQPISPTDDMSGTEKFLAGMGKGFVDLGRGVGQMLGLVDQQSIDEARKTDAPLMATGAGTAGNVLGSIAAAAPTMLIPGANTVGGAALVGGALNALQPVSADESRLKNTAVGAALGGGGQFATGKLAQFFGNRLAGAEATGSAQATANAVKDEAIREARAAGFKTVPSISGGSLTGRLVEGATGKEKAAQLMAVKNRPIYEALARKALQLPDDAPLTHDTMRAVRAEAVATGYEPVRAIPRLQTDGRWKADIAQLTSRADNASKDFGAVVQSDVKPLAAQLRKVKSFTGDSAVDTVAIFREKASDLYAGGNKTLGSAYRKAAEAIEGQIERGLPPGSPIIADYRAARARMAQSFDLEKAIREGDGTLDARVLGKMFSKKPERFTGELRQIARAASVMPEVMAPPKAGWSNPITALDSGLATFGGIIAGNPAPLAYPLARAAGRYGLLSDVGQDLLTTPSYGPGAFTQAPALTLEEMRKLGLGGLLGSAYAAQE